MNANLADDLYAAMNNFGTVVSDYHRFLAHPAAVRRAAATVRYNVNRLLAEYGDEVMAYADHGDALRAAACIRNTAASIHAAEVSGNPLRWSSQP